MKLKQVIFLIICLALGAQIGFAQDISIDQGTLKFSSIAAYERFAENISNREVIRDVTRGSGEITTMEERGSSPQIEGEDIYPDFLQSVLNDDNIFGIGSFLVKLDLENGRGLAIQASVPNAYALLKENRVDAAGMMEFSNEEENALEILEMIEAGELTPANYRMMSSENPNWRACPGAARYTDKSLQKWDEIKDEKSDCNNKIIYFVMDNKVVYQKFIFYFSLQSKMNSLKGCVYRNFSLPGQYHTADLSLNGSVRYRKRCRDDVFETRVIPSYINNVISWRPYEGSRSLSHYDFQVTFGIRQVGSGLSPFLSRQHRIRAGY